jgi:NTE family protein
MTARPTRTLPSDNEQPVRTPRIGLALGGGGARGLGHIAMLEAFDELGVRPSVIAGASIGAIYGAAYASGISGRDLREHTRFILSRRFGLARNLFTATAQPFHRLVSVLGARSAILDAAAVLDLILPAGVARDFSDCGTPLKIVASDFYDQEPIVFTEGPLRPAIAASMALPVIFQPVVVGGRVFIDGGLTNPLPFDLLMGEADIVVAVDVSGAPVADPTRTMPTVLEALFASAFLFERSIIKEKLKCAQPDILISAGTSRYQVLDFLKFDEILAASKPAKEKLKRRLARILSVETLPQIETPDPALEPETAPLKRKRRSLLARASKRHNRE